jgi:hypothetical protein
LVTTTSAARSPAPAADVRAGARQAGGTAGGRAQALGLEQDTLAKDMQKGGLKLALEDLVAHMKAAGITSKETGASHHRRVRPKAGAGLNILVNQMDKLESKYPALEEGAKNFGKSWADTQKTFAFQVKSVGDVLRRADDRHRREDHPAAPGIHPPPRRAQARTIDATVATAGLLAGMVALSAAMKVAAGIKLAWTAMTAGAPWRRARSRRSR